MLQLEITPAALAPQHAHATIEYLIGVKLWPGFGQAEQRSAYQQTCAAVRTIDEARALPGTMRVDMLDLTLKAAHPDEYRDEIPRRWAEGWHVGEYYATAIGLDRLGVPVSVKRLREFMIRSERRRAHPAADISESQLRDLLREYRPAAHLWTAYFMQVVDKIDSAWPCSWNRVDEFLAMAEWVAARLAAIRLERRNKPLLGPDADLWRVPPALTRAMPWMLWPDAPWPAELPPPPTDLRKLKALLSAAD